MSKYKEALEELNSTKIRLDYLEKQKMIFDEHIANYTDKIKRLEMQCYDYNKNYIKMSDIKGAICFAVQKEIADLLSQVINAYSSNKQEFMQNIKELAEKEGVKL